MTDRLERQEVGTVGAVPCVRSRPGARPRPVAAQRPLSARRATVRRALDAALRGATLDDRDRQFLSRLIHCDKRNAAAVAALLWKARLAGRAEAGPTAGQMEIVLTALSDAAIYRTSGADAVGCSDCENTAGGRCADHARDDDRASACSELAAQLAAGPAAEPPPAEPPPAEPLPAGISGFRRRAPVAS